MNPADDLARCTTKLTSARSAALAMVFTELHREHAWNGDDVALLEDEIVAMLLADRPQPHAARLAELLRDVNRPGALRLFERAKAMKDEMWAAGSKFTATWAASLAVLVGGAVLDNDAIEELERSLNQP